MRARTLCARATGERRGGTIVRRGMALPVSEPLRRSPLPFFAIVFGTTWLFQLPALLVQHGIAEGPIERFLPLVVLGYFAPTIAAFALSSGALGGDGVRALLRPFARWRVGVGWYVVALALPGTIFVAATALARLTPWAGFDRWFYPPREPAQIASLMIIPFTEQIAWRGFAYPRVERVLGPAKASVLVGALWAMFHLQKQALLGPGIRLDVAAALFALMSAGFVVFTWICRRTGGSMLLVVVAHMGVFLDNPSQALPRTCAPLAVDAAGFVVVATALLLFDRATFREPARASP